MHPFLETDLGGILLHCRPTVVSYFWYWLFCNNVIINCGRYSPENSISSRFSISNVAIVLLGTRNTILKKTPSVFQRAFMKTLTLPQWYSHQKNTHNKFVLMEVAFRWQHTNVSCRIRRVNSRDWIDKYTKSADWKPERIYWFQIRLEVRTSNFHSNFSLWCRVCE